MIKGELGYFFANYYFGTQNEMNHFCQMVHHQQDGVMKTKRWKVYDEVYGN
jgi:hypothetical protein